MSECVVRMDHIPRNCLECPLNGQCGIFADWVCTLNSPARKHYPQPFDKGCNILAVLSEPHGRLVDADGVSLAMVERGQRSSRYKLGEMWELNGLEIQEALQTVSTIVPAEK